MALENCTLCGKIYEYIAGPRMCPNCYNEDNNIFKMIKEYLEENPRSNVMEVSLALGVTVDKITYYLKQGRLEVINDGSNFLVCESCGKSIASGRYCDTCFKTYTQELKKSFNETNQPRLKNSNEKMRYLNKR